MLRKVKFSAQAPLTNQPPRPSDSGHYEIEVKGEEKRDQKISEIAPENNNDSQKNESFYSPSAAQKGVAIWVRELYRRLAPPQSGLWSLLEHPLKDSQLLPTTAKALEGPGSLNSFSTESSINQGPKPIKSRDPEKLQKIEKNSQLGVKLESKNPGAIPVGFYIHRLFEFGEFSEEVGVVLAIYIQRALVNKTGFEPKHLHKLIAGCLVIAFKYLVEDSFWNFDELGYIFGVGSTKLEEIEEFVLAEILEYQLYVSSEEYDYAKKMLSSLAC